LDPNTEKQLKAMNKKKKIDTCLKLKLEIRKNILVYVIYHVKLDFVFCQIIQKLKLRIKLKILSWNVGYFLK